MNRLIFVLASLWFVGPAAAEYPQLYRNVQTGFSGGSISADTCWPDDVHTGWGNVCAVPDYACEYVSASTAYICTNQTGEVYRVTDGGVLVAFAGAVDVTGVLSADGGLSFNGSISGTNDDTIGHSSISSYGGINVRASGQTVDAPMLMTGSVANAWLFVEYGDRAYDFAVPLQTNPTFVIQSANQSTTESLLLAHNQTNGQISTSSGNLLIGLDAASDGTVEQGVLIDYDTDSSLRLTSEDGTNNINFYVQNSSTQYASASSSIGTPLLQAHATAGNTLELATRTKGTTTDTGDLTSHTGAQTGTGVSGDMISYTGAATAGIANAGDHVFAVNGAPGVGTTMLTLDASQTGAAFSVPVRQGTVIAEVPTEPFTCDAAGEGYAVYVDDTNDTAYARECICANLDGTGYDWRDRADIVGTACPFF